MNERINISLVECSNPKPAYSDLTCYRALVHVDGKLCFRDDERVTKADALLAAMDFIDTLIDKL